MKMAKKVDQATVIILDIGKNTSGKDEDKTFLKSAIDCTKRIIERKIMCQGKDLIGIFLMGTKETKNSLAEQCPGTFKHIKLFVELETPSWKMIRELPDMPAQSKGDWFDAIIVAADYFKNGFSGVKCLNKRIILMTNFESNTNIDKNDFEQALGGFQEEDIEIDVIGCDIFSQTSKSDDLKLIRKLVEVTKGVTAPFDDTMRYLLFHKRRHVSALPWNVDLCIGPNIKIPVSSYIRIKDEPMVKSWGKAVRDPVTGSASTNESIIRKPIHVTSETRNVVEKEDLIKGYYYGQNIIPLVIDESLTYKSGLKSLTVYGFTQADKIQWQNLNGDGLMYVFGRKGDKKAEKAVICLVQCLKELNLVAIVRRVYNNGNAPKMFALMPVYDTNDYVCLSMVELCFKEEIKIMAFPTLEHKKFNCTDQQVDIFKKLISAMDLTNAYDSNEFDDKEAFPVAETISPSAQYVLDCIAFRAMNPKKPLPPPRDDIMELFKVPTLIEKNAIDIIDKMKSLFVLKKVELKNKNKNTETLQKLEDLTKQSNDSAANKLLIQEMPKIELPLTGRIAEFVPKIGTVNPINDYKHLLNKGRPLSTLTKEMSSAIECLFNSNINEHAEKAFKAMEFFRSECVKNDPSNYNNWLQNFKIKLYDQPKNNIIEQIKKNNLDFIVKQENNLSNFDEDFKDESQIYEMDTAPSFTELVGNSEINNLFDD